jgi:hypothetical protein
MFCGCCVKFREKYKHHVRAIYPIQDAPVQNQAQNLGALTSFAKMNINLLQDIGFYLQRLILRDLAQGNLPYVMTLLSVFL